MSTSIHPSDVTTPSTVLLPQPREAADPLLPATVEQESGNRQTDHEEPPGLFSRHAWLIPAGGIGATVATFTSMILLNWAAGGGTPFGR